MNTNTKITLVVGWYSSPEAARDAADDTSWSGTLGDFWRGNEEYSYHDVALIAAALDKDGFHRLGGGAAAAFTVIKTPEEAAPQPTKFALAIDLTNAAFRAADGDDHETACREEIARILYAIADAFVHQRADARFVRDINGNSVGKWEITRS